MMHPATAALGDRRVEQVSAYGGGWFEAKQQHKNRRHQRAAANAGEADQQADNQAGKRECRGKGEIP
jgi:hypothetical protein